MSDESRPLLLLWRQVLNGDLVAAYLSEGFPANIRTDFEVFPTGFMSPRAFLFRKVRRLVWRDSVLSALLVLFTVPKGLRARHIEGAD